MMPSSSRSLRNDDPVMDPSKTTTFPTSPNIKSGQIIATSAEVTPNDGLVRESPQNPLNSGLGSIVIYPDQIAELQAKIAELEARQQAPNTAAPVDPPPPHEKRPTQDSHRWWNPSNMALKQLA